MIPNMKQCSGHRQPPPRRVTVGDGEQRDADADQDDTHIFHRTISKQPLKIVLREGESDTEQSADRTETDHHPPRGWGYGQPATESHNTVKAHLDCDTRHDCGDMAWGVGMRRWQPD